MNGKFTDVSNLVAWYPFSGQGRSCLPTPGAQWTVEGSQACNVSRNFDLGGYNVTMNGTGRITISANITGCKKLTLQNNVTVILTNKAVLPCSR
jgi:hypothetical protein